MAEWSIVLLIMFSLHVSYVSCYCLCCCQVDKTALQSLSSAPLSTHKRTSTSTFDDLPASKVMRHAGTRGSYYCCIYVFMLLLHRGHVEQMGQLRDGYYLCWYTYVAVCVATYLRPPAE